MEIKSNYKHIQARQLGFDRNAYTSADEGDFSGMLVMKVYGDFCLRCYFETDDGRKLKITAWQDRRTKRYGPRASLVDFKAILLGTKWENTVGLSQTGKVTWRMAKEIGGVISE
ncbi:MAG: hypothetical protein FWC09_04035 [Lachnospiraceae bacterium]|nr:hypothetical protein [Lachnospiraceae bacterium]